MTDAPVAEGGGETSRDEEGRAESSRGEKRCAERLHREESRGAETRREDEEGRRVVVGRGRHALLWVLYDRVVREGGGRTLKNSGPAMQPREVRCKPEDERPAEGHVREDGEDRLDAACGARESLKNL